MSDLEKLKEKYRELTRVINTLTDERSGIKQEIAEINCPFKTGDIVINKKGEKAEVSIITSLHGSVNQYMMKVRKFRKNGHLYINHSRAWESDLWKLDE